jgi:hypothetical protein
MDQLMALLKESGMENHQLLEHLRHQDVEQNLDVNLEHLRHQDVLQNQDALNLGDCLPSVGVLPDVVDVVLVDEESLHRPVH